MSNHDDFVDDYIEYRIFEESMKGSSRRKPPKSNNGGGCCTWAILTVIVIVVLILLASCTTSSSKSVSNPAGSYKSSYSTSPYSATNEGE